MEGGGCLGKLVVEGWAGGESCIFPEPEMSSCETPLSGKQSDASGR